MNPKPLSIENRWDLLYRDFPDVYDEFAAVPKDPEPLQVLMDRFDVRGKLVADIGSGSGRSTFTLAGAAERVIGVELEEAMRELAEAERARLGLAHVEFVRGDALDIPLPDSSVDIVTGITLPIYPVEGYRQFVREARRIAIAGGWIVMIDIAPGWYGGELASVIQAEEEVETRQSEILVHECDFSYEDFETSQEYGSLDKIVRTYGFIFGRKAIDYLTRHGKTNIKWRFRIHYQHVEK